MTNEQYPRYVRWGKSELEEALKKLDHSVGDTMTEEQKALYRAGYSAAWARARIVHDAYFPDLK